MSQAQPLSTLAPEYSNQVQQYTINPQQNMSEIQREPCPKDPCATVEKDPCAKTKSLDYGWGYGWGWLGVLILWFIIFTVLFWLIYYSLKPSFVLQSNSDQVDTGKVLLAAVISALILVVVIWLIKIAIRRKY